MIYFLVILLLVCLVQDVRFRGVHWSVFPLILASTIIINWNQLSFSLILWNTVYLLLLITVLTIYVSAKKKRWVNITKGYFSWGDVLILVAFIPLFFFEAFLFFVTVGTVFSLLVHLLVMQFDGKKTIPFTGYIGLFAIPIVLNLEKYNHLIVSIWT